MDTGTNMDISTGTDTERGTNTDTMESMGMVVARKKLWWKLKLGIRRKISFPIWEFIFTICYLNNNYANKHISLMVTWIE